MSDLTRRQMLGLMASAPVVALDGHADAIRRALEAAGAAVADRRTRGAQFQPRFFTAEEWRSVRVLVDLVIPRDDRSASASDAGVPEFMDFMMLDRPQGQNAMRNGLAWLDRESRTRFNAAFADAAAAQQIRILDDIAWPDRAPEALADGVRFFNMFRDLTASGFWSSEIGIRDLRFMGNTVNPQWNGCAEEALRKLGVSYGDEE